MSLLKEDGIPVLILANEISNQFKSDCREQLGVFIWDVSNLLWLFNEFPNIKSEFIASLGYTVDRILPVPPIPYVFRTATTNAQEKKPDFRARLRDIAAGNAQSRDYEIICTEILKDLLSDHLTMWKTQEYSNDGLYRFDLFCRIKMDVRQDFFDTIKRYFNTKYIVFEFKNYEKPITPKEVYTTEKYLYEKALRKVAIIVSRKGADEHAQKAMRGSLRESGKLILYLSDNDLLDMISIKQDGEDPADFLANRLDDFLLQLEK